MGPLNECRTEGCSRQTTSSTGFCASSNECSKNQRYVLRNRARGRSVSTPGKAARGTPKDQGSNPCASTDKLTESLLDQIDVLQEELEDAKAEIKRLRALTRPNPFPGFSVPDIPVPPIYLPPLVSGWQYETAYPTTRAIYGYDPSLSSVTTDNGGDAFSRLDF